MTVAVVFFLGRLSTMAVSVVSHGQFPRTAANTVGLGRWLLAKSCHDALVEYTRDDPLAC
ncbi:MAG: hypothetical protein QOG95_4848, partial [Mycobacterium sp.]|nr:hypothetical protein [Mycobacterium sp.]